MRHAHRLSPRLQQVVVALLCVASSPAAFAGPIRDAAAMPRALGPAARAKTTMKSPALFWGGVAAASAGALFVIAGVSGEKTCLPVPSFSNGSCVRETAGVPLAIGIPLASAGVGMMVVGGRHHRASIDVAATQMRLRIRF